MTKICKEGYKINPKTGRCIKIGGYTDKKLIKLSAKVKPKMDGEAIFWCTHGYCSYFANFLAQRTGLKLGYVEIVKGTCSGYIDHWFCHTKDHTIYDIEGKFNEDDYKKVHLVPMHCKLVFNANKNELLKFNMNLEKEYCDEDEDIDRDFIDEIENKIIPAYLDIYFKN